ncbi:MAG: alpha/beta hydrolase [bacterium]|nr:alpha/beta hydrolase [bacterium]
MKNIIIVHGAYGNPEENWIPWLKLELEKLGCNVIAPKFPTPEGQSLENWFKVFREFHYLLTADTIVVGHSLGPAFLLKVIENLDLSIRSAFFVAGFISHLGLNEFDEINVSFYNKKFDWKKIKKNCNNFHLYYSDNDPYVPVEKSYEIAKNLRIEPKLVAGAGHFNSKSGYTKFELLFNDIRKEL